MPGSILQPSASTTVLDLLEGKSILTNMSDSETFQSPEKLVECLKKLRAKRTADKSKRLNKVSRKSLSDTQRKSILSKTAQKCHICGGKIKGSWDADHVHPHSKRGAHCEDNYLPAHPICNSYRKCFDPEEIQWILKLGVWLKTQIEKETKVGQSAAEAFCKYEKRRSARRVK